MLAARSKDRGLQLSTGHVFSPPRLRRSCSHDTFLIPLFPHLTPSPSVKESWSSKPCATHQNLSSLSNAWARSTPLPTPPWWRWRW